MEETSSSRVSHVQRDALQSGSPAHLRRRGHLHQLKPSASEPALRRRPSLSPSLDHILHRHTARPESAALSPPVHRANASSRTVTLLDAINKTPSHLPVVGGGSGLAAPRHTSAHDAASTAESISSSLSTIRSITQVRSEIYLGVDGAKRRGLDASGASDGKQHGVGQRHLPDLEQAHRLDGAKADKSARDAVRKEVRHKVENCRKNAKAFAQLLASLEGSERRKRHLAVEKSGDIVGRNIASVRQLTTDVFVEQQRERLREAAALYDLRREAALSRVTSLERSELARSLAISVKLGLVDPGMQQQLWRSEWFTELQTVRAWFTLTALAVATGRLGEMLKRRRASSERLLMARAYAIILRQVRVLLLRVRMKKLSKCRATFTTFVFQMKIRNVIKRKRDAVRVLTSFFGLMRFTRQCVGNLRLFLGRVKHLQKRIRLQLSILRAQYEHVMHMWIRYDREKMGLAADDSEVSSNVFEFTDKGEMGVRYAVLRKHVREKKKKYLRELARWHDAVAMASASKDPIKYQGLAPHRRPRLSLQVVEATEFRMMQAQVDMTVRESARERAKNDLNKRVSKAGGIVASLAIPQQDPREQMLHKKVDLFGSGLLNAKQLPRPA